MADKSHLIPVGERYARQSILRNMDELEVESSSINSKTCSLAFSTNHCGIAIKFPTELLEEIHMSGAVEEYNLNDSDESECDELDGDEEEAEEKPKKKKQLKRKGK